MAQIKRILCAVDFSEASPLVASYAKLLAQGLDAEVLVLYVAPSLSQYVGFHVPPSSIETFVKDIVQGADATMEKFLDENFAGVRAQGEVATGYAAEEILNHAKDQKVDMIIMGTHGRKGIDRILFGSVAEKVVKSAICPVLTVRPEKYATE
ncbi:UspA domain-containing protein [Alkalidesulfovibrio alkalitolerans DSM 16529]|uniref:Universal stress protein n=1 Tax=Alkalidesulfovibrio alkalitolerans DSM 16529 TaxID=1121439 RepID=S7T8B7_9BACT|nr:universal stress protein [Alkalidesulfovibrio alkalitolerans]EPR32801.1 UspA domain-containing protein [Alkalidesulfovibrio alkalitolerans DSM 16529]